MNDDVNSSLREVNEREILVFLLYREALSPTMRSRDRLPYSPEFDNMVAEFNRRTGENLTHRELWDLALNVLKTTSEPKFEEYLRSRNIPFKEKPKGGHKPN
ncbi:MAG: hypothetical protein KF873_01915 [Gemmataceae bacterium]|nr:hypothetical protein [Planctomycetia bacterium]MBX3397472.1 hypothetical protein [Gemmataceae bacterium]